MITAAALGLALANTPSASAASGAPGVNPKDNITKVEVFAKSDRLDGGVSLHALAVKYDHAFDASTGANVEIPLIRVDVPGADVGGLGDVALRARMSGPRGPGR